MAAQREGGQQPGELHPGKLHALASSGLRKPHQPARQAKEGGVAWRPGVSWGLSDPPPWRRAGGTRGSGWAVRAGAPHGQQHSRVSMLSGASPGPCRDPSSCQHPFRS